MMSVLVTTLQHTVKVAHLYTATGKRPGYPSPNTSELGATP